MMYRTRVPVAPMWCGSLFLLVLIAMTGTSVNAQEARNRRVGSVPREISREVIAVFNAATTTRVRGDYTMTSGDTVRGNVAVLAGRARIAGVITGQLVVINGDAVLDATSRIDGSLTVLGGSFESPDRPIIGGDIRVWSARLRYHEEADTLVADLDREFFSRWREWQREETNGRKSQLFLTTAHTYNRVEGLPIYLGPRLQVRNGNTGVEMEAFGIYRTGSNLAFDGDARGYRLRMELKQGRTAGFFVGGRLFDEIDAVEKWQLSDTEIGLSTFLFTRDYRDYWQRHGGNGYLGVFGPGKSEIRASYGKERWSSRLQKNVASLFNSDIPWRYNPQSDDGVLNVFTLSGKLDTRNRDDDPRSGWYIQAEYEHGDGILNTLAPTTPGVRAQTAGDVSYGRAHFDIRRYNRLSRGSQLNVRAVAGGWVTGDPLPMQRRFAVSGLDALPGWDFRQLIEDTDTGTCASGSNDEYRALGRPAQCERMVLVQAEFRGDFRVRLFDRDGFGDRRWMAGRGAADGAWVLFANTGRGWLSNDPSPSGVPGLLVSTPKFGTWRSDVGGGLDFGTIGVYVAKAVSDASLPMNVYVRLGRRF